MNEARLQIEEYLQRIPLQLRTLLTFSNELYEMLAASRPELIMVGSQVTALFQQKRHLCLQTGHMLLNGVSLSAQLLQQHFQLTNFDAQQRVQLLVILTKNMDSAIQQFVATVGQVATIPLLSVETHLRNIHTTAQSIIPASTTLLSLLPSLPALVVLSSSPVSSPTLFDVQSLPVPSDSLGSPRHHIPSSLP